MIRIGHHKTNEERCLLQAKKYQGKFPHVPAISSTELVAQKKLDNGRSGFEKSGLIIVDVRSAAERSISVIPGSVSLADFEDDICTKSVIDSKMNEVDNLIVLYCTVGYRSGMEATRLKKMYDLENVYNLDGIVAYTHAAANEQKDGRSNNLHLVHPLTQNGTYKVHTFGPGWGHVPDMYEIKVFPFFDRSRRMIKIGATVFYRTVSSWRSPFYFCKKSDGITPS
eukprot:scaffold19715_cov54-Attheya_sp.AAC.5